MSTVSTPRPPTPGRIRIGIGGWTYAPWRGSFYPPGLAHGKELAWASSRLNTIEVNGTYFSTFDAATYRRWRDETPEDFVFSLKANRFATTRKLLATAGPGIQRFVESGISELGEKLGPIVWQFMPTKAFDPDDFEAFLALLPASVDGRRLRHVLDVRHPTFATPRYLALAARHRCVTAHTDAPELPDIRDAGADFAYLRLMRCEADVPSGYPAAALQAWARGARAWARSEPSRDVFIYFINGAKERAPAAAQALTGAVGSTNF